MSHKKRNIAISSISAIILIIIFTSISSNSKNISSSPTIPVISSTHNTTSSSPNIVKTPIPVSHQVFHDSGNGDKTTASFSTENNWAVNYTYNCSSFGYSGNFIVESANGDFNGPSISSSGMKGEDTSYVYNDSGMHALDIVSECDWTINVISN